MRSARRRQRASGLMTEIGKEVLLARATLGLSRNATARLAGIASSTLASIEAGKGSVQIDTVASVCESVGLRLWAKAYPAKPPSLRDTGQLELVASVTSQAHSVWRPAMELVVDPKSGRAADLVLFGPDEIQHQEFERNLLDWQAQYRSGRIKQELLSGMHQRPVRFVLVIEDTHRNREILMPHMASIRAELPAGSREIWRSIRTGRPLARDGLLWLRRPRREASGLRRSVDRPNVAGSAAQVPYERSNGQPRA
jgi:transcriptional regulator with XRE-family HTH domain